MNLHISYIVCMQFITTWCSDCGPKSTGSKGNISIRAFSKVGPSGNIQISKFWTRWFKYWSQFNNVNTTWKQHCICITSGIQDSSTRASWGIMTKWGLWWHNFRLCERIPCQYRLFKLVKIWLVSANSWMQC